MKLENFKDWEQIGYYKESIHVRLCLLELQEELEANSLILSKDNEEKSHFVTLLLYASDYTEEDTEDDSTVDYISD